MARPPYTPTTLSEAEYCKRLSAFRGKSFRLAVAINGGMAVFGCAAGYLSGELDLTSVVGILIATLLLMPPMWWVLWKFLGKPQFQSAFTTKDWHRF